MALVQRAIDVTVTLGEGSFGEAGPGNTVKLSGYRVSATIAKNGIPAANLAEIRIYGMSNDLMNKLSRLGQIPTALRNNVVSVEAGDADAGMSVCFAGIMMEAWADFQGAPEVSFNISGQTGALAAMKPEQASSFSGPTDVAVIMAGLAKKMGYTFENNGVSVILASPYLWGTARQQAISAAAAANINVVFDNDGGVMAITPINGARGTLVPLISAATGMVGYPVYNGRNAIRLKTLYNPAVQFLGSVQVDSVIKPACGKWRVVQLTHNLESQNIDGGEWFTEIVADLGDRFGKQSP